MKTTDVEMYPWISDAVKSLTKKLKTTNKCCLIMPTGMGKTWSINEYLKKNTFGKVLYLAPNDYILEQTQKRFQASGHLMVNYLTYPRMTRIIKNSVSGWTEYDLVILDEFHRLGAPKWGQAWKIIEASLPETTKIIGLTATERRYLDNNRDMAKELFGSNIAYQLSLTEAWAKRYMKAPYYIICNTRTSEILEDIEKKMNEILENINSSDRQFAELKKEQELIRRNWQTSQGIPGILKKHLRKDLKKLLIFHNTIMNINEVKKCFSGYLKEAGFKKVKFFEINSGERNPLKQLIEFNKPNNSDCLWVGLSINMLNEGLHIEGCDTGVLFRCTFSSNVYFQQIGRFMSFKSETRPVIIDMVDNIEAAGFAKEASKQYEAFRKMHSSDEGTSEGCYQLSLGDAGTGIIIFDYMALSIHQLSVAVDKLYTQKPDPDRAKRIHDMLLREYFNSSEKALEEALAGLI